MLTLLFSLGLTFRLVGALATAFILMLVVMPRLIAWLKRKKFGETGAKNQGAVVVDAMREGKKGTPTMGGLGIVLCIAATTLLWCEPQAPRTWLLLYGLLSFALLGFLDDRTKIFKGSKGTPLFVKLGIQFAAALGCGIGLWLVDAHYAATLNPAGAATYVKELQGASYTVTLGTHMVDLPFASIQHALYLGFFSVLWTMFVTIACANGVNFTDGMDGLASGTMVVAALAFAVIAYLVGRVDAAQYLEVFFVPGGGDIAVFCTAVAGACLGFLWFNCSPAEVFMGDTGSQALGGILGLVALSVKQEFLVLLVGAVFVVEAASVALQIASFRLRGGKRIFLCAPIHHHFQMLGWSETKIVIRFWILAACCALLAVATLKLG
jgi:phospho-N-acetylmuramoyl-pentapeptide-transferase